MTTLDVDVAVIGAGTAGLSARREVEKAGKRSVLIEAGHYGTTCAREGCMPSKLLIAAADAKHAVDGASRFGVRVEAARVDGAAVLARVKSERDRFVGQVVRSTERVPAEERLRGSARFLDRTTLLVGEDTRVRARAVVIASGSSPWVPPPFDVIREHVEVSADVFEWRALPRTLAVVGTGIVALELGQALHRLGVETVFFNPFDELGPFTSPPLQRAARSLYARELELHLGITETSARVVQGGVRIGWVEDGAHHERTFERVLVAAGRRSNLAALDLAKTGLPLDAQGKPPWDRRTCQCGDSPIFMAGDVIGRRQLLHEASDEGHIAGANAACFPEVTAHVRRAGLSIAFTDPQIAIVGRSFAELPHAEIATGEVSYEDQGRARLMGANAGLVELYAERASCRILGAEMLGPSVEHLAHLVAWAVQRGMTVQDCLSMPFYHPTLEEGLRTALIALAKKLDVVGGCRAEDLPDECPGM
jgi:dihydrolipoamide dehydrogenase